MAEKIKKIWNAFNTVVIVLAVILVLLLVGVRFIGMDICVVLSGSMEPAYHTGSVIYIKKDVDPEALQVGDPITFELNGGMLATHRIIELVPDEADPSIVRFRTKGDANDVADGSLVEPADVVGTPVFTIPYLGFAVQYIQNPPGKYVALMLGAFLILMMILPEMIFGEEKKKAKSPKK